MAKQTLKSLLGSSDEREQVELNLNPVALQPTIRSGGNYRVAVQQTPKTNSALQFADALKQGVGLYGQAVNIAQDKAIEDVATMSEEDFDKVIAEGLDEDSRNIFGYTKAYNQSLAKKYYAEKMPTKLQAIAAELHKDPYAYKDPAQFEAAAIAAVNEAYDEADELLGGNVFSEQANNALKSATKADFVAKQQATYLAKLPEITRQNASEGAFNAFSKITKADTEAKAMIDAQIKSVTEAVGNRKEAAAIVTKAYLDNIEALAKQEGQEELAQALLDELDDTTVAGLGSQGRRGFGEEDIELFNTAENRLRIEQLEDDIENAGVAGYNARLARAREAQAVIELEAFGLIAEAKGDETPALARFEELEAEIRKGSVTLNGVTYTDKLELNEIRVFIAEARNNKDLFVHNAKLNFINNNTGSKRAAPNQITKAGSISKLNLEASKLLFASGFDSEGRQSVNLTPLGQTVISQFNSELEQLELQLADSLLSNTSLSQGDRITEYSKLYPSEVTAKMQDWMTNRLNSVVPEATAVQTQAADAGLSPEEQAAFDAIAENPNFTEEEIKASQEDYLALKREKEEAKVIITGEDGSRELKTTGFLNRQIDPAKPYQKARDNGYFKDSEEQAKGLDSVNSFFNSKSGIKRRPRNALILRYNQKANFPNEDTVLQQAEKKADVREFLALYGLSLTDVANDELAPIDSTYRRRRALNKPIMLSGVYGSQGPFLSTPILIDGSINNTINLVEAYFSDKDNAFLPEELQKAANVYGMDVDVMLTQMRNYLTTNNFISK